MGDEAWVELPGAAPIWDEYAIVEVTSFSDGRARVELIERMRVLDRLEEPWRQLPAFKSRDAGRLVRRLDGGQPAWVPEYELMTPEDGELDAEAKREVFGLVLSGVWAAILDIGEMADNADEYTADGHEEALRLAEGRGLDDEALGVEITWEWFGLVLNWTAAAVGADVVRLIPNRADAVGGLADAMRARLADDPSAGRELLNAMQEDQFQLWSGLFSSISSDGPSLERLFGQVVSGPESGSPDFPRQLEAIVGSWESLAVSQAIEFCVQVEEGLAGRLERHMDLADSADVAVAAIAAALEAAESVADLVTMDGERRFQGRSRREIVERRRSSLALAVARSALRSAGEEGVEADATDPAEAVEALLDRARGLASEFDGTIDLEPVWGEVEAEHLEKAAETLESDVRAALNEADLQRASAAMDHYASVSRTLGSFHARHDRRQLNGATPGEFAESAARRLGESLQHGLRRAALAFLDLDSNDFDSAAHDERIPRLRALMEPFDAALGREALDERFFNEAGERAKANDNRKVIGVGQVWTGSLLCGEATRYQRYREGSSSRGSRYHGPERLALTLELTEAEGDDRHPRYQGMLTAQNLPSSAAWRDRNPRTGEWTRSARPESTQFVVLSYNPHSLAVSLSFGVLDRAAHVERHGDDGYVRNTEGDWQSFNGSGSMDPSKPMISGWVDRRSRYIDDTCREFTLSPSGAADSKSEFAAEDGEGTPEAPVTGAGPADGGRPPLSGLTEQTYLGGMKKRGMKVFALSAEGDWCGRSVILKFEAESGEVFSDGTAEFYMRRFGRRINDEDFCPTARVANVVGFAGAGPEPCFSGRAEADEWRIVSGGGGAQCD